MQLIDKRKLEAAAEEMGLAQAFVEKDWYVVQVLALLSQYSHPKFQLCFSGGTSLSKGYKLINRFSEDIDFKVLNISSTIKDSPAQKNSRKERSEYYEGLKNYLIKQGVKLSKETTKHNENKFFKFYIKYDSICSPEEALRPDIQVEMSISEKLREPLKKPIRSFIRELMLEHPEVENFLCIDPIETAADKVTAFTWRSLKSSKDERLVRHLYDLYSISRNEEFKDEFKKQAFIELIDKVIQEEIKTNRLLLENKSIECYLKSSLEIFEKSPQFEKSYNQFVINMIYDKENEQITFKDTRDFYIKIVENYIKFLSQ